MNIKSTVVAATLLTLSQIAAAQSPSWYEANRMLIQIEDKDSSVSWEFAFAENGDMSLEIDRSFSGEDKSGTILLVSGELMLTRNLDLKKGSEIDVLDGPALQYQLVTQLLAQAFPDGPASITSTQTAEKSESEQGIRVGTSSATGLYEAPWNLNASVERISAERINYTVEFTFQTEGSTQTAPVSGFWEISETSPALDSDMNIGNWNIHTLGPFMVENKGGMILDYGAIEQKLEIKTLGELKAYIAEKESGRGGKSQ